MQLTRQSEYAIRTLIELAQKPYGTVLSTKVISERQSIPEVFLKKTVQLLARAQLVATQRGTQGGVKLAVPAEGITIAQVITAIEGEVAINPCLSSSNVCENRATCSIHRILQRAQDAMLAELNKETLQDIAAMGKGDGPM
jgi:Rrf2 family transcriptional regulator, nitric oxide-sensitive transcriptional repressor